MWHGEHDAGQSQEIKKTLGFLVNARGKKCKDREKLLIGLARKNLA